MRRSREDTAQTRKTIVETAARLFRARGITLVSVADIMGELDLAVGGFYRHFESKDALVAEAIDLASETAAERLAREHASLPEVYLSKAHRDHAELGCPVAALCSEVAHEASTTKESFTRALTRLVDDLEAVLPGDTKLARDRRLFSTAAMVGALVLSRATSDERLADELLRVVRTGVLRDRGARA